MQFLGGGEHFAFQFVDGFGQVHVHAGVFQHGIGFRAFRFVGGKALLDGAAHAARRDVVLLVVGDLFGGGVR